MLRRFRYVQVFLKHVQTGLLYIDLELIAVPRCSRNSRSRFLITSFGDYDSLKKKMLVHKIRLNGRRGKGMAESFSREK